MSYNAAVWLETLLELSRKPVGIRFFLEQSEYEQSALPEPRKGLPYCTTVMRATLGHAYKMNAARSACIAGSRALGFSESTEEVNSGKRHSDLGVYKNLCVSRSVARDMVYCAHHSAGVEIKPLASYNSSEPDIVIMVVNSYTAMRIVQAYAYHHGQLKNIKMAGMCAICQECTSYPYEMNTVNISMLCSGTRCVARWEKNELALGMPFHYLKDIIDGLMNTVNPMEDNNDKDRINKNLLEKGLESDLTIKKNQNYYKGAYGTPEQVRRRKKLKKNK